MITAGLDLGAKAVKAVILQDGEVTGRAHRLAGWDPAAAGREALEDALDQAGVPRREVHRVVATGAGRSEAAGADRAVTEVSSLARAAAWGFPAARVVLDVGAEEGRVVAIGDRGQVSDFVVSERCAAGTGAFVETLARALEVPLQEVGPLALQGRRQLPLNLQCVVFAESEVVSLIHENTAKEDIAKAVMDAMGCRVAAMARRVKLSAPVVLVGGLALNVGFVEALRRQLLLDPLIVPTAPEFFCALGAALAAARSGEAP